MLAYIIPFIINLSLCISGATILFRQWNQGEKKFYTDLPFLLGIALIIASIEYADSSFGVVLNWEPNLISTLIATSNLVLICTCFLIIIMDLWIGEKRRRVRLIALISIAAILDVFSILFTLFTLDYTMYGILNLGVALPATIAFSITFFQCYKQRRLPNVHPKYLGVGFLILSISWIGKAVTFFMFEPLIYGFPIEVIIFYLLDIVAYSFAIYGIKSKAHYNK